MKESLPSTLSIPTTRYSSYLLPFVLNAEQLHRLHTAFTEFGDSVTFAVDCEDGLTRSLSQAELAAYENSRNRAIVSLQIFTPASGNRYARMRLRNSDFENVEIDIAGDEANVLKLSETVDDILARTRPWYCRLAKYPIWQLGSLLLMTLLLLFTLGAGVETLLIRVGTIPAPHGLTVNDLALGLSLTSGFALTYATILSALEWFRITLFPVGTFALGQGKRRYHRLECVRWIVLLSLLAGLLLGILSLITKIGSLSRPLIP